MIIFLLGVALGILLGRVYGWMKYHYPEFQEEMNLRVAKKKADRAREEARAERHRGEIDDELSRRMT
jgi:hypothetical protein